MAAIQNFFTALTTAMTGIGLAVSVFFLMWGGYLIMSSGGSTRQMESGKGAIIHAIIGLVIVIAANAIMTAIKSYIPAS